MSFGSTGFRGMQGFSGNFNGFRLLLLPLYAGVSTILDAIISERGPSAVLRRGFAFEAILNSHGTGTEART